MTPAKRLGIIGKPRSAMLAAVISEIKLPVRYLDPFANGEPITENDMKGKPADQAAVLAFGQHCDVLHVEDHSVDVEALRRLRQAGKLVFPSPEVIELLREPKRQQGLFSYLNLPATVDLTHSHIVNLVISRKKNGVIEAYSPFVFRKDKSNILLHLDNCDQDIPYRQALAIVGDAVKIAEALELVGSLTIEIALGEEDRYQFMRLLQYPVRDTLSTFVSPSPSAYVHELQCAVGLRSENPYTLYKLTGIVESLPFRRHLLEQSLMTILSTSVDYHEDRRASHAMLPARDQLEHLLQKAIVIRHLLQPGTSVAAGAPLGVNGQQH